MRVYNICIVYKRLKIYMFYFFSYHSCINLTKGKWHFFFFDAKKEKMPSSEQGICIVILLDLLVLYLA